MTKFSIKMKNDEQILFLLPNKVFLYIHVLLLVLYLCHNENFKMFSFIFMFLQMFLSYIHKYQNIYQLLFIHAVNVKFTLLWTENCDVLYRKYVLCSWNVHAFIFLFLFHLFIWDFRIVYCSFYVTETNSLFLHVLIFCTQAHKVSLKCIF